MSKFPFLPKVVGITVDSEDGIVLVILEDGTIYFRNNMYWEADYSLKNILEEDRGDK